MKKVLVTGANGFLASNLIRELLFAGYDVRGMVREGSNLLSLKKTDCELFTGDISKQADVRTACSGCEIVIHLAANTQQWPTNPEAYRHINVEATRQLLAETMRRDAERFIFVSTANTFDPGTKDNPGTEESPFTTKGKSGYMLSKHEAQQLVLAEHQRSGFPIVVVNPTFMLGKHDARPSSGQIILMAHQKHLMGYPPGGKNFVHVQDVARGIVNAIEQGRPGHSYLLANENLSYREFFEKLGAIHGSPEKLFQIPKAMIRMVGEAGQIYQTVLGKASKLDRINSRLLCADNYYSPAKAVTELNLKQTPVSQAISDALEWFGQYGYLS